MRHFAHSIAAGFIGFLAIAVWAKGDVWGAWSFGTLAALVALGPVLLVKHEAPARRPSPMDAWLEGYVPPQNAPTAIAPADPLNLAGAIGAAPANREG